MIIVNKLLHLVNLFWVMGKSKELTPLLDIISLACCWDGVIFIGHYSFNLWITRPESSLGSNHVALGGIIFPLLAMSIICCIGDRIECYCCTHLTIIHIILQFTQSAQATHKFNVGWILTIKLFPSISNKLNSFEIKTGVFFYECQTKISNGLSFSKYFRKNSLKKFIFFWKIQR